MKTQSLHSLRLGTIQRLLNIRSEDCLTREQIKSEFEELKRRINALEKSPRPLRSGQLLRFDLIPTLTEANLALETVLEKYLARETEEMPRDGQTARWANQIPVWSGVCGSGSRRCTIDIGYSPEAGKFSLYELKIKSNHPLYAIVELITYALGYFFVRERAAKESEDAKNIRKRDGGLMNATNISFSILAPKQYYDEKKAPGGITLSRSELATVKVCAEELLRDAAKPLPGGDALRIEFLMKEFICPKDRNDWDDWVKTKRDSGQVREVVLGAKEVLYTTPDVSQHRA